MSANMPLSKFVIGDFGVGLVLAAIGLGFVSWRKRFEVSQFFLSQPKEAGEQSIQPTGGIRPE